MTRYFKKIKNVFWILTQQHKFQNKQMKIREIHKIDVIKANVIVGANIILNHNIRFYYGDVKIGNDVCIGNNVTFMCSPKSIGGGIEIGNDVMIASDCYFVDSDHGMDKNILMRKQPCKVLNIVVGNDVWIGRGCTILKGVHIGNGAVIGAGSIVTHDVPPFSIFAGNPAKQIRKR